MDLNYETQVHYYSGIGDSATVLDMKCVATTTVAELKSGIKAALRFRGIGIDEEDEDLLWVGIREKKFDDTASVSTLRERYSYFQAGLENVF